MFKFVVFYTIFCLFFCLNFQFFVRLVNIIYCFKQYKVSILHTRAHTPPIRGQQRGAKLRNFSTLETKSYGWQHGSGRAPIFLTGCDSCLFFIMSCLLEL
uniref:(northern house mosquito) hypothetical protein n=1 Tax=Culex pipiens TaxID=7175 RepID=A0A8D8DU58_CULPI